MRLFRKNKGAISVFLVIILVPCMLISSIFVDISRVELSKAVAESAGDLALNTLMTNYDYDLSDHYGLMGSCQDISEYYETASEYYEAALHSKDIDNDEIKLLYQSVINDIGGRFQEETISDILLIKNQTEGNAIGPVKDANMYNAAILQEQVVEFMKYRAPIEIVQEIISRFKSDSSVSSLIAGQDNENDTLIDDKTEFYEAEGELLKAAFDVYWLTRDYTDQVGDNGENLSAEKLQEYASQMKGYREVYQEIHRKMVSNLMNTSQLSSSYSRVTIDLDKYEDDYDETSSEIYSRKEKSEAGSDFIYYIDGKRATDLLEDLQDAKDDFVEAKNDFISAGESLMSTLPGTDRDQANPIQWWVKMNTAVNNTGLFKTNYTNELRNKADAMVKAYAKLNAALNCTQGNNMPANWETDSEQLLNDVKSLHGKYLEDDKKDETDNYLKMVNYLEDISESRLRELKQENLYVSVDGKSMSLSAALSYIAGRLDEIQKDLDSYIKKLDKLLKKGIDGNSALDKLYKKAEKYDDKLVDWTDTANGSSTEMGEENRAEIQRVKQLKEDDQDTEEGINITIDGWAVREMEDRLSGIRDQLKIVYDAVDTMKYGSSKLVDIDSVNRMKSKASGKVSSDAIPLKNQELETYADQTFGQLFRPTKAEKEEIAVLKDVSDSTYNPLMSPVTEKVDTPELYRYFHKKFQGTNKEQVAEKEKEQGDAKKQSEEKEKEKNKDRYTGGGTDITPTDASSGNSFSFIKGAMTGLVGAISNLVNGRVDSIRDNLYVTTYMMNMFSYATYENEGYYGLLKKDGDDKVKKLKLSEGENYYVTAYKEKEGQADTRETWLSENVEDSYNKTLTNKMINKENNAAYMAEIEYILYGKSNSDSVKAAYNDIFVIRYALNLISAFANFWGQGNNTGKAVNGIALGIASATAGLIPAALTKVILLPILAVFETCKDLDRLQAGFPVELYKKDVDWWCSVPKEEESISGFMGALTGDRENPDKGIRYSDYLTLFVFLGLQSGDATSEKMYLRMGDVIQANMQKRTNDNEYALTKTQVYFQLKTKLRVDPLMLTLPYFSGYVEDPTLKDDWCTFEVESIRGY